MTAQIDQSRLWADFCAICDCGGRLLGSESELKARSLLSDLGRAATGVEPVAVPVSYEGWQPRRCELTGPDGAQLSCHPLVRTPGIAPGGLEAEVVDVGRGTPEEFAAHAADIPGRIVLVRHELMFAAGTIHRMFKVQAAYRAGAVGFLIAGPLDDSPVAGSSGRDDDAGIPAAGISRDAARALARTSAGWPRVKLVIDVEEASATAENLFFDVPGKTDEWVVLSAHIDGHDLAESAIDNASGLAVVLAVVRSLSGQVVSSRRGLRIALFNVEEWALTGSARYVEELTDEERLAIVLNVNVDSVGTGLPVTALSSGFVNLEPFLISQAEKADVQLGLFRPLQMNSDHGNFAMAGVPAFRLVSGFNDPAANTRHVLTAEDNREKAEPEALAAAARLVLQTVVAALDASQQEADAWRTRA